MSIDNSGDINTIILAAGKFNPKNISSGMITDPGLLPIRGKPAINWCIDAAKKNGAGDIKIVLRSSNTRLSRFLGYSYPDVRQIFVGGDDDAATALVSMLGSCNDDMPTQIILGDTLINEPFPEEADVFLASPNIKTSKQWCLATKDENGHLLRIYNKERDISVTGKEALAGYYKFSDTRLLKRLVFEELRAEQPSIINVFLNYNRQVPILIKTTRNWFDFGHISGAVQARLGLFSAREFNNLAVDAVRGTITKISKKKQKLLDEANWYQSLPKEISCYAPRVFDVSEDGEFARVEMELYGYANLAETFIYGSNNLEDWYNIIEALLKVHKVFEKYTEAPDRGELEEIYIVKTEQRLAEIAAKYPRIAEMMQSRYLTINSTHYRNYPEFKEDLAARWHVLPNTESAPSCMATTAFPTFCLTRCIISSSSWIRAGGSGRRRFTATRGTTSPNCATVSSGITILSLRGCTGWSRTGGTIMNFRFRRRLWRRSWSRFLTNWQSNTDTTAGTSS